MKKHKFNIFPEASPDDYAKILNDIRNNGYDTSLPITTYQGDIMDGWNRQRACNELGVTPIYAEFVGSDTEAVLFMMRTNNRRTVTSAQWACIAAESEEILEFLRAETERVRREKQAKTQANTSTELSVNELTDRPDDKNTDRTTEKAAKMFNTNREYISKAVKLKKEEPEKFEQVKAGKLSINDATGRNKRGKPDDPDPEIEPLVVDGTTNHPDKKIIIREDNGMAIWASAKCQLDRISKTDSQRIDALNACVAYCQKRLTSKK
jgi:hypothetical protein